MSTTETLQSTSFESIPLQTLTGPAILPKDTEDDHPDIDAAQARPESREPQIEVESSAPAEAVTEDTEIPSTKLNSVLEKWHLGLNATQVLIGVLAFAGFLAMVKFTIIDHSINNESLKLSEWTAWMAFRDECRALRSETEDIGPDCQDVLYQPLSKPPVPMAESTSHDEKNTTLVSRTTRDDANAQERLSDLHVPGVSIAEPTLRFGISVLSLAFGLGYVGYVATRRLFSLRKTRQIDTNPAWVQDHVARLHPDGSQECVTAKDTESWSGILRKRVVTRKTTSIEEQYEEFAVHRSFRKRPKRDKDTESLLENWDKTGQHDEDKENEGPDHEGAWLPTAISSENEKRLSPLASEYYFCMVESILAKLAVLGYDRFAFDHVDEHAGLEPFWTTATQRKCSCEFGRWSASSALIKETSTLDSIFPQQLLEDLKAAIASYSEWLVEIPKLNFDSITVCIIKRNYWPRIYAPHGDMGRWTYWQSGKLETVDCGFREAPCLRLTTTLNKGHVRVFFENVTIQDYNFILDRLGMDYSKHDHGALPCHRIPTLFMQVRGEAIKKVMLAASEGSLHAYARPLVQSDGSLKFKGRCIGFYSPLDQMGESLKLVPLSEAHPWPPPSQICVEKAEQPQDALVPEYSFPPFPDYQLEACSLDRSGVGKTALPKEGQGRSGPVCSDPAHMSSPNREFGGGGVEEMRAETLENGMNGGRPGLVVRGSLYLLVV